MAIEFTVDHDHTYAGEEGIEQLIGWVTFSVSTYPGDFRVREQGAGVARTMNIPSRRGWLATDGHLYKDQTLEQPCRLVANDPTFNLKHLTYRSDFELTTVLGDPVAVPLAYFPAPSTDTTLYLTKVMIDPSQPVMEVRAKAYAEDILDAGTAGIGMLQSETTDDAWSTLGAGNAGLEVLYADTGAAARSAIGALTAGGRSPILGATIRGGNIAVKPGYQWQQLWAEWDWGNWIKPQIDRAVKLGLNTVRLIGGPNSILADTVPIGYAWGSGAVPVDYLTSNGGRVYICTTAGTTASSGGPTGTGSSITDGTAVWKYLRDDDLTPITQAQYDARWRQLVEYCGEAGLNVYPCLCTGADFVGVTFQDADVTDSIVTTAGILADYTNVIGFDLLQEGDSRTGLAWASSHSYSSGTYVNNGGKSYLCTTSGTSASSGGPTGTGSSITDGTAVWSYAGVPLFAADVVALMAAVRSVCNVPLTMSTVMYGPTSPSFYGGESYLNYQVNADPAGVDFVDVHIYDAGITTQHVAAYADFFGKPVVVGEFGADQSLSSDDQIARYVNMAPIHALPGVAGSLVWALADQASLRSDRQYGCWDNTGFVQGNDVTAAAPLSTTSGVRTALAAKLGKLVAAPLIPKQGTDAALVCTTQPGGVGTENGANTWAKIASVSFPAGSTYTAMTLVLEFSTYGANYHDSAIVSAFFAANAAAANPTVSVDIIAKGGAVGGVTADSFKVISGAFDSTMELWVKKGVGYGGFNVHELARSFSGTPVVGLNAVTYSESPAWQSAAPTGAVNNVSSAGVTAFGVPVATTTGTQTFTGKTISGASNTLSAIAQSSVTNLTTDLAAKEATANKDAANGYAGLNASSQLTKDTTGNAATATKLATARTVDGVSFDGSAAVVTYPARLLAPPTYTSGQYYFCSSPQGVSTSAGLGNGIVRLTAWLVTQQFTLSTLFCEYTVAGESGSKFRIGIWSDDGTGQPGALFFDAGQVATDGTPAVVEVTGLSQVVPPGLYWVGGAVQNVVTTQPTMRICGSNNTMFPGGPMGASLPVAGGATYGFGKTGQTGSFATISSPTTVASAARIGFKVT